MTRSCFAALLSITLVAPALADDKLEMHVVPIPVKSYRLLAMSQDEEGFIWTGSIHEVIHRYDPRRGKIETIKLPYKAQAASSCICVGKKVYVLGQTYPRLIIYDRTAKEFREVDYPSAKPNVWYGTEAIDGRYLYLFDRGAAGVIKWDTKKDTGTVIAFPYKQPLPSSGQYDAEDKAIWCKIWDNSKGQYGPVGIARLDIAEGKFTGWYDFPKDDTGLKPYTDPANTLFLPFTLKGQVVPFDVKEKRWCSFLKVPRYGEMFAFMGGPIMHKGRCYFSLSTYDGDTVGCDGQPYHFLNAILEFDPRGKRFEFLTLEAKDAYHQISYMLSAGDHFFATGSNIREADGKLNQARAGEVVFWQSVKPGVK